MSRKTIIWIGMFVGSSIGGYIPVFFGGDILGMTSIFTTAIGGILGIWAAFKMSQ
jgi:hypothetical protein